MHLERTKFLLRRLALLALTAVTLTGPAAGDGGCTEGTRYPELRFDLPGLNGDVYLNYRVVGQGKCVIVALHGFGGALDTWNDIEKVLGDRCRFYVPDLVGFGLSARPDGFTYTVGQQAEIVARFLEFVQRRSGEPAVTLIGHSYGGAVAAAAYAKLQNRSIVGRLVLIDALADPKLVRLPLPFQILRVKVVNKLALNLFPARTSVHIVLNGIYSKHDASKRDAVQQGVCRYAQFLDIPGAHIALISTLRQDGDRDAAMDLAHAISRIGIPALIIWGKYDPLIPRVQADRLHDAIPDSRMEFVDTGHAPQEEAPDVTARLIAGFLSVDH
jgi:pimeloyl-ACP methyl ester carboxylesterase